MKFLLGTLIVVALFAGAWSITCYRCGGQSPSCKNSGSATIECDDSSLPNAVFACQVYTVNYTTLAQVLEFKSCCLYEDCNKNPCDAFGQGTVCSKMASCQSDKCNSDYATAKAAPRPTLRANASKVTNNLASVVLPFAVARLLYSFI